MKYNKKIKKKLAVAALASFLCFGMLNTKTLYAAENVTTIQHDYDGDVVESTTSLQRDVDSNLLVDNNGNDLTQTSYNGRTYNLKEVSISRYRQKVRIEYYLGDYNTSTLIGIDEGYADYNDSVRSYIMKIDEINSTFHQSISTNYRLFPFEQTTSFSSVPEHDGTDNPYTVKVLVAEVKKYSISATKYQNRQDMMNPNPVGKIKLEIDGNTEFWKVHTLSTFFYAVDGQIVDLQSVGQFRDSTTYGGRTGSLSYYGVFDDENKFQESATLEITDSLTGTIYLGGFYEVEDYGSNLKNPGHYAFVTSGGVTVGFTGSVVEWKPEVTTETLQLADDDHLSKLSAYSFQLNGDPFDTPDYPTNYVPSNWILGHKLVINYRYELSEEQIGESEETTTPNENEEEIDGSEIPITPDENGGSHTINKPSITPSESTNKQVATYDATNSFKYFMLLGGSTFLLLGIRMMKKVRENT